MSDHRRDPCDPVGRAGGVVRVGVDDSPSPPLCFGLPGTPEFRGFEVDLLEAIAAKLGAALRFQSGSWDTALGHLQSGQLDMLCRAVAITPERRRVVDFSDPYLETELSLVVRRGSSIQGAGDLIGVGVGVRRATTAEMFVRMHSPAAILRTFDDHASAHRALGDRAVDAVVDHTAIARYFAREVPGLQVPRVLEGTGLRCGMVLASGNEALRNDINRALMELRADGTYQRCQLRWFAEVDAG